MPDVEVSKSRRCKQCNQPLIREPGGNWHCEFDSDHDWDEAAYAEAERDIAELWRKR